MAAVSFGRTTEGGDVGTRQRIADAAREVVLDAGVAGVSTRRVAEQAGVPLSQLHYHFGSKQNLVLEVLRQENERLLERQAAMYASDLPLWERWRQACDFLDEDLRSGYVRILHEAMAAGWTDEAVAQLVRPLLQGWFDLLDGVATEAEPLLESLHPISPREMATLVAAAFLGGEALLLLEMSEEVAPVRTALRRIGDVIRQAEEHAR